jgi:N-methylhydantoinase B
MRKVIDDSERTFANRLANLPDGEWVHHSYIEIAGLNDRHVYPLAMRLRKEGSMLHFDNEGTHPQVGSLNTTVGGWRSGILAAATPMLGFDLMHATGGMMRRIAFSPTPGTIFSASHPGAVSNPQFGVVSATDMAVVCLSRMMASSEDTDLRRRAMAGPSSLFPVNIISGLDRHGVPYGTLNLDPMGGGLGAMAFRDGQDTGGQLWDPISIMPNVEYAEQYFPVLYLYRRELADSGGAGTFRGGNSAVLAFTPHKVESVEVNVSASGWAVPTALGLFGGYPACTNGSRLAIHSAVADRFASGTIPQSPKDVAAEVKDLPPKQRSLILRQGDVYELWWTGGGGFGDPTLRDPQAVLADVLKGATSREFARSAYGVVIEASELNASATEKLRRELRKGSTQDYRANGRLTPVLDRETNNWNCPYCGTTIGSNETGDYLAETYVQELRIEELSPHNRPPELFVDNPVLFEINRCAGCGTGIDARPSVKGFEPRPFMRISASSVR